MYELFGIAERFGWTAMELLAYMTEFLSVNGYLDEVQDALTNLGLDAQPDA